MKLSELEEELKAATGAAFGLGSAELKGFTLSAPPPHIKADLSLAWPISAAKVLKESPLKIAGKLEAAFADFWPERNANATSRHFCESLVRGVERYRQEIDERLHDRRSAERPRATHLHRDLTRL